MKNLFLLFVLVTLISCSAENNTANTVNFINCDTSALVSGSPNANEIVVTVSSNRRALVNAVVQLDDSGLCLKTDANGKVLFTNVSSGAHDIHIFGPPSFDWHSIYNIDAALGITENVSLYNRSQLIVSNPLSPLYSSYINLKGSVATKTVGNEVFLFILFDKTSSSVQKEAVVFPIQMTNYNLQYGFTNEFLTNAAIPIGTPVTAEIWAFEYKKNILTGERILIDTVKSTLSLNTTSNNAIASVHDINFIQQPTTTPVELLKFGSLVAAPTGLTITDIHLFFSSSSAKMFNGINIPLFSAEQNELMIKSSYSANIPQLLVNELKAINFSISASDVNGTTWLFESSGITVASNVDVRPQEIPIITVFSFSSGLISWSSTAKIPTRREIFIDDTTKFTPKWRIKINGDNNTLNSITLPSLPLGLTPILAKDKEYDIIFCSIFNYGNNTNPVREIFSTRVSQVY